MALLVQHLLRHINDTLGGGELPSDLDAISIVNQAGEHLHSMHAWKWAQGRSTLLSTRGTISLVNAAWNASAKTLTLAGAFTNYTFVDGDEIEITGGTATTGFYEIASRTNDNVIVLSSSIAASNQTDVDATLQPYSIDLPDDLREIIAIQTTDAINSEVTLTSLQEVLDVREDTGVNDLHAYAAIAYVGTPPTPVLEIAPGYATTIAGAMRIFYRARWARLSADAGQVDVPEFCEALLIQLVRAFARGYTREDQGSLHIRLAEIQASPLFMAAKMSDGSIQPYHGKLRGGGADIYRMKRPTSGWRETTYRILPPA
jgi:hypothetical protein